MKKREKGNPLSDEFCFSKLFEVAGEIFFLILTNLQKRIFCLRLLGVIRSFESNPKERFRRREAARTSDEDYFRMYRRREAARTAILTI